MSDILALLLYVFTVPLLVRVLCALVDLRGDNGAVCEDAVFSDSNVGAKWSYDCVCVAMMGGRGLCLRRSRNINHY